MDIYWYFCEFYLKTFSLKLKWNPSFWLGTLFLNFLYRTYHFLRSSFQTYYVYFSCQQFFHTLTSGYYPSVSTVPFSHPLFSRWIWSCWHNTYYVFFKLSVPLSSFDILFLSRPSYCIRFPWSREFEECLRLSRSQFTMPHIYSSLYSCIHAGNHRLVCSTQCERSACVRWGPNLLAASTNALNFPNWLLFLLLWLSNHFSEPCIV